MTIRVYTCVYIYICILHPEPKWPLFPSKRGLLLEGFFSPKNGGQTSSRVYMYIKYNIYIYIYTPKCSMYGIFTYIWLIFTVIVGKYTINWASGICTLSMKLSIGDWSHPGDHPPPSIGPLVGWYLVEHRGTSTGAVPGDPLRKTQWLHPLKTNMTGWKIKIPTIWVDVSPTKNGWLSNVMLVFRRVISPNHKAGYFWGKGYVLGVGVVCLSWKTQWFNKHQTQTMH